MQLCLLYKLPTLAVRIFLLMRKHKIELTPITYSYYNKAIIECWSSFEQDRWAKLRLIWHVVYRFKKLLLIKKERERQKKKKSSSGKTLKRKKILITNKKNTIINNTSNHTSNLSASQLIMKQSLSQQSFKQPLNKVEKEIQTENDSNNSFKKLKVEIRQTLKKKFINKTSITSTKFNKKDFDYNKFIFLNDVGILTILSDKTIKACLNDDNKMIKIKSDLNLDKLRTLTKVTFISPKRIINKKDSSNSILTPITVTHNDPLSTFSQSQNQQVQQNSSQVNHKPDLDKVKKKLFDLVDYVPFSDSSSSLNQIKQSNSNSDFIFNNNINNKKDSDSNIVENLNNTKEIDFIYNQNNNYNYNHEEEEDEDGDEYLEDDDVEYDSFSDEYDDSYYDTSYEDENEDKIGSQIDNYSLRNKANSNIVDIENASISSLNSKKGSAQLNINNSNNNNNNSNLSLNENNNEAYGNNNFTSPITPFLGSRVISFMRKMENSLETSGSKIKVMSKMITEKTQNIKEIIISNTNQPESITSKLMSISSYNLSSPQQYLNGLIKSNTNLNEFVSMNNNNNSVNQTRNNNLNNSSYDVKNLTPSDSVSSQTSLDKDNFLNAYINSSDLDMIQNDETFKPLSIKWWCLDKTDDYLNFFDFFHDDNNTAKNNLIETDSLKKLNEALIDIQISSCNYCEKCDSFLYDEEIMSGWTLKDSDLNVKCFHCSSLLVPNLYIKIQDLDTIRKYVQKEIEDEDKDKESTHSMSPRPPLIDHPFDENHDKESSKSPRSSSYSSPKMNNRLSQLKLNQNEFTVQYLSPLVVRKELENIIMHNEPNDDKDNLIDSKFIDEHSVVFWNLIWYFKRIGVDYGQLAITLLNSRLKLLREKNNSQDEFTDDIFKFKNYVPNHVVIKPYNQHPNVKIRCMWDNLRLQDKLNTHEVPLYLSWIISSIILIKFDFYIFL